MTNFTGLKHWTNILATCGEIGEIYLMEYSENLSQQYKYEPPSGHFSKQQDLLNCTVKHTRNESLPYEYIYHLSNVMKHGFALSPLQLLIIFWSWTTHQLFP